MINENRLIELLEDEILRVDTESTPGCGNLYGRDASVMKNTLNFVIDLINEQPKVNEWIPVEERLPEEHKLIDDETGYYNKSDEVLCCCKNEYNEFEYWIDYTIDGEWQYSEYIDGDEKYWQPLPEEPYLSGFQYPLENNSKG